MVGVVHTGGLGRRRRDPQVTLGELVAGQVPILALDQGVGVGRDEGPAVGRDLAPHGAGQFPAALVSQGQGIGAHVDPGLGAVELEQDCLEGEVGFVAREDHQAAQLTHPAIDRHGGADDIELRDVQPQELVLADQVPGLHAVEPSGRLEHRRGGGGPHGAALEVGLLAADAGRLPRFAGPG
jgi:hypothetical protein